ncbi:MAG: putative peptidoglycan glycosyltransferase FtsW [Firmicutes bacterium]|nr:putative peptidoglycan glycosyltransferase FtsW [Bacillota bacterium]
MEENNPRVLRKSRQKPKLKIIQSGKVDIVFLSLLLVLVTAGLISLFSASYSYSLTNYGDSYHFIKKQAIFAVVGLVIMFAASKIDYHIYRKFAWLIYFASLIMLVVVLILPPLQEGFDYKRWLKIGGFSFQPSEIAKFAIILLFSHLISNNYKEMENWRFIGILVVLLGAVCGLVVVETHLSATLLIFAIGVSLIIIGGLKLRYVAVGLGAGVALGAGAILSGVVGYGGDRIQSWLDPWSYYRTTGWQTIQSLLAIGSGGFLGRGIGESRQKYLWVPEPHNDFIFAIVCEEIGFVGAIAIIGLFVALIWRGYKIAMGAPDKFGSLMAIGLTLQVGLQAALNIMVVTNTIPNTGISLPFFSYGGTALVMLMAQMGVILSISRASTVTKS